jgi:hypothetical protein
MANAVQLSMDAADPRALGTFWMEVLGYIEQPPPPGFATWDDALKAAGFDLDTIDPNQAFALVDPDGHGPRMFIQKVPEGKTAKNRMHLDVIVGKENMRRRADELVSLGGTFVGEYEEPGGHWVVMHDPEGNEFCLH